MLVLRWKNPVMNDTLMSKATNGDSNLRNSLTNHVGAGSKLHFLLGASPIIFSTSLAVTGAHASMLCEAVVGMSCFGVVDVDWRTVDFVSKKMRKIICTVSAVITLT